MAARHPASSIKPQPLLVPLMSPAEQIVFITLAGIWLSTLVAFWVWWVRPEHNFDNARFIANSVLLLWTTVIPGYFVAVFSRARLPNPDIVLPKSWRVAMVVTKAPSEPFHVVKMTLEAMLTQTYAHDTWLADEDPGPETLQWCSLKGVMVSTRKGVKEYHNATWPRRTKCKEGNLAYFYDRYGYEAYDFVAQLDADHVPNPTYLEEVLRPFLDPRVGYVSAPSICDSNADASWSARGRLHGEGALHGALQAGYNGGLAPLCIGSHYAVRTKALMDIGGLGPELAEDHSTTLIMNSKGWRGIHALNAIAHGEGPPTFAALATQEFQWSRSLCTILFRNTAKYFSGLSALLRVQFLFSQLWYPLFSITMALSIIFPIIALLTGNAWVSVAYPEFFLHVAGITTSIILLMLWVRNRGWFRPHDAKVLSWEGTIFLFARWPWSLLGLIAAICDCLAGRESRFRVTPKGTNAESSAPLTVVLPYICISIACAVPAFAVNHPGNAAGFYVFTLVNSFIYLLVPCVIVVAHERVHERSRSIIRSLVHAGSPVWRAAASVALCVLVLSVTLRASSGVKALLWQSEAPQFVVTARDNSNRASNIFRSLGQFMFGGPATAAQGGKPITLGVYDPGQAFADSDHIAIEHIFVAWNDAYWRSMIDRTSAYAKARNRWLMVTVEPWPDERPNGRATLLDDIQLGYYDREIANVCTFLGALGVDVFVRWGHEMDLPTGRYPWASPNPDKFIGAYRYFVTRCRTYAPKLYYVWSPSGDATLAAYFPGSSYVDVIGVSVFDCPACDRRRFGRARSARETFAEKYDRVKRFEKPIMIAECGVSGEAGRQESRLNELFAASAQFPLLQTIVYFNSKDVPGAWGSQAPPDWTIDPTLFERKPFLATVAAAQGVWAQRPYARPGYSWGSVRMPSSPLDIEQGNEIGEGALRQGSDWLTLSDSITVNSFGEVYLARDAEQFDWNNSVRLSLGTQLHFTSGNWAQLFLGMLYQWDRRHMTSRTYQGAIGFLSWQTQWHRTFQGTSSEARFASPRRAHVITQGNVLFPSAVVPDEAGNLLLQGFTEAGLAWWVSTNSRFRFDTFGDMGLKVDTGRFDHYNKFEPSVGAKLSAAITPTIIVEMGTKYAYDFRFVSQHSDAGPIVFLNWKTWWW
jgi:cellulose synthase (UDP-forming)